MQNLMCSSPVRYYSAITFGSRFALLISCNLENGVQGGEPMIQKVFVALINLQTRLCALGCLRSHACPVQGSFVFKSRLHPGLSLVPPNFLLSTSWHTLGCENLSHTSGPLRSNISMEFLRVTSTRMLTCFGKRRCSSSSGTSSMSDSSSNFPVLKLHTFLR